MKEHQAMMKFKKWRQRDEESIDQFLDDIENLGRRRDPEDSANRRNFSNASNYLMDYKLTT